MKLSSRQKTVFYFNYFFNKFVRIWFEVKRPRLRMFIYEAIYSFSKFLRYESMVPSPFNVDLVETVFGKFRVRPRTVDMINASPAFERDDIDRVINILDTLRREGKRVLFLDIGADIGTFSVSIGNRFKDYEGFRAMAFEPSESFGLLRENISLNSLEDKFELIGFALYDEDGLELEFSFNSMVPGSSGIVTQGSGAEHKVMTKTLDSSLAGKVSGVDALFLKIDVEGVESEVIRGGREVLKEVPEVYLLVEDFINPEVIALLREMDATFLAKLTPYNSFWLIRNNN